MSNDPDITGWTPAYFAASVRTIKTEGQRINEALASEGLQLGIDYHPDPAIVVIRNKRTYIKVWFREASLAMKVKLSLR